MATPSTELVNSVSQSECEFIAVMSDAEATTANSHGNLTTWHNAIGAPRLQTSQPWHDPSCEFTLFFESYNPWSQCAE